MIYELEKYTELQIKNWQMSERIILYTDEIQFLRFVDDVIQNGNNGKKIYFLIPKIVMQADEIKLDERKYENKDVLIFRKVIDDIDFVVTYVSNKHKDLSVQTMYARKNKKEKPVTTPSGESLLAHVQNA